MSRQQVRLDADNVEWVQLHNPDGLSLSGATNLLLRTLRAAAVRPAESPSGLIQLPEGETGATQRRDAPIAAQSRVGALARRSPQPAVAEGGLVHRPRLPRRPQQLR